MSIAVECEICGKQYKLNDSLAGKKVNCKACGTAIMVPGGDDDDLAELDDRPARRKGASSSGKRGKKKKSSNAGLFIGLGIGGLVVVGALIAVVVVVMRPANPGGDPNVAGAGANTTNSPAGGTGASTPAQNATATNTTPAATNPVTSGAPPASASSNQLVIAQAPLNWQAQPDPPAEALPSSWDSAFDIPVQAGFIGASHMLYPVVPSAYVLVGENDSQGKHRELWNLSNGKKEGTLKNVSISSSNPTALSPDGRLVAWSDYKGVDLFDVIDERGFAQIPVEASTFNCQSLAIVPGNKLVGLSSVNKQMRVWQLPEGKPLQQVELGKQFAYAEKSAYSPGGKYIALESEFLQGWITVYDIANGKAVGELRVEKAKDAGYIQFFSLAFSPDGKQLAGIWDASGGKSATQIAIWNMADGKLAENVMITPGIKAKFEPDSQSYSLQWFPDGKRFLVHGVAIVDRAKKETVYTFEKNTVSSRTIRRPLSPTLVAGYEGARDKGVLKALPISDEEIARASSIAQAGGLPEDQKLPTLTGSNFTAAATTRAASSWTATPDVAPALPGDLHTAPLSLASGTGIARDIVLIGGEAPQAFVRIAEGENLNDPKFAIPDTRFRAGRLGVETIVLPRPVLAERNHVAVIDLVAKNIVQTVDIPFSTDLVDAHGNTVLVKPHNAKGRLDVYDTAGKHVVGFRPYKGVTDDNDLELRSAVLVDATHVVTTNLGGKLVGWEVPGCKPTFAIDDVSVFALSPGKRDLACATAAGIEIRDARTGAAKGTLGIQGAVAALAFHPQGEQLAVLLADKGGNYLYIADVKTGQFGAEIPCPVAGPVLRWSGDKHLLIGQARVRPTAANPYTLALFDIDAKTIAWTYRLPAGVVTENTLDQRLWYAAPKSERVPALQLVAVALPEPKVTAALAANKLAPELLVQPGGQVALTMNIPSIPWQSDLSQKLQDKLKAAVEKTGAGITTGGNIRVEITAKPGTGNAFQVSKLGERTNVTSVQENNFELTVKYLRGQEQLWTKDFKTSNNLGFGLKHLQPNQSIQQALDNDLSEKITSFVDSLVLPSYVFTRRSMVGLGSSILNGDGPVTGAVSKANEPVAIVPRTQR